MSLPNEIKSKLSAYLQDSIGLADFRLWFADVLRAANGYSESDQKLIWSVDRQFASLLAGRIARPELLENLKNIFREPIAGNASVSAIVTQTCQIIEPTGPTSAGEIVWTFDIQSQSPPVDMRFPVESGTVAPPVSVSRAA